MPWTAGFIAALGQTNQADFRLRKVPSFTALPGSTAFTAGSTYSPVRVVALSPGVPMALSGQSLSVPSFSVSQGTFRVGLAGVSESQSVTASLPRGSAAVVEMKIGSVILPEPIMVGQVRDVSGIGPQSVISCWDALSLVISRPEMAVSPSVNDAMLFSQTDPDSGHTDTLAANFNFGTDTTITLSSAPTMERETGRPGAVLITPSGGGDPYIVTFTGTSGNDLTGVSTTAIYGTTGSNASIGDAVQEVAYINRNPVSMAIRVLTSTGTGTNGANDTLPASWGLGVPIDLIDVQGFIDCVSATAPASGAAAVHTVATSPQGPALSWLQSTLQTYGMWLCMRQGQISIRPALDYYRHFPAFVMTLDSSNIIAVLPQRQNWDTSNTSEARDYWVFGETLLDSYAISEAVRTRPANSEPLGGPSITTYPAVWNNQAAINQSIAERVGPWHTRIATVVDVQCTLAAAQLCVGDWVQVQHLGLWDHTSVIPAGFPRPAMVTSMSTDWTAGVVTLRLHCQHSSTSA